MQKLRAGQTWKVRDVRKGDLTLKLTEVGDGWAEGEIVEGKVRFTSYENSLLQRTAGLGTKGDVIMVSFQLCNFIERITDTRHRKQPSHIRGSVSKSGARNAS